MPATVKEMISAANDTVPKVTVEEARRLVSEEGALLIDVRDTPELASARKLEGALNVSRGMLEFRADEGAPYHEPEFRRDRPLILYCASGGRLPLSGKVLHEMGYERVYNLGGFRDAADAGFPTEGA